MANPALETFTDRGMVLKKETVEGTSSNPTSLLNAFQILDGKSKLEADTIDRAIDRVYWNSAKKKFTNFRMTIEGSIEIVPPINPGVGDASVGIALEIAGMAKTLVAPSVGPVVIGKTIYNPISRGIPSATSFWWHAGEYWAITGVRANITGLSMEIGKYLMAQVHFEGSATPIAEQALPTDFDYSKFLDPTDASTESMELLMNSFAVQGKMLSMDFGNQLKTIQHTEARIARIGSKQSTWKSQFYKTALADFNPEARWRQGDIVTSVGTIAEPDGRKTVMTTRGQVTDVASENIDGDFGWTTSGILVASDAGNDEFLLEFRAS